MKLRNYGLIFVVVLSLLLVVSGASAGTWTTWTSGSVVPNTNVGVGPPLTLQAGWDITVTMTCSGGAGYSAAMQVFGPSSNYYGPLVSCATPFVYQFVVPQTGDYDVHVTNYFSSPGPQTFTFTIGGLPVDVVPGPDMVEIPSTAVVGKFTTATTLLFAPDDAATSDYVMGVGQTLWVLGTDSTGMYYQVLLSGQKVWVPVANMGPNFDDVWQGRPLPTEVVE